MPTSVNGQPSPARRPRGKARLVAALLVIALAACWSARPAQGQAADPLAVLDQQVAAGRLDADIVAALRSGREVDAILLVDDVRATTSANQGRQARGQDEDDDRAIAEKAAAYTTLKASALSGAGAGVAEVRDFSHFGAKHVRVRSADALARVLSRSQTAAVRLDVELHTTLTESLALINQPAAAAAGYTGAGTSVAVLDTGVNYMQSAFGCSAVATPSTCKVAYARDFATDDGSLDDNGHGTNVAGIVAGVAPGAKILALDVFRGGSAWSTDMLAALDWIVQNRSTYNIAAANMSLGDSSYWTSGCGSSWAASAFSNLRAAGILPVVSAGNGAMASGSFQNGVSSPACTPGAISVGAVYDSVVGGLAYTDCTDTGNYADKVTCFSQSGPTLSMWAPGALITAAGYTMAGTSQAAPHVAGATAVLLGACSNRTATQRETALTGAGPSVTDSRSGASRRRLDVMGAVTALGACSSSGGTATKLAVTTQPAGATAGAAFTTQPAVTVQDASNATVTSYTGAVTLAIKSGTGTSGAVLNGTKTVNAVAGVATFTGLSINTAGTGYVVTATASGLTSADSSAFTVAASGGGGGGTTCSTTPFKADMSSPTPSSTLSGTTVTFDWTAGCQATAYWLHVGTVVGGTDKYTQNTGTARTATVSNLPTSGTVYVRLWTQLPSGWQSTDYTYTAGSGGGGGSCTYTLSSTSASAPAAGTSGTVTVSAGSGCAWTATSNTSWLTVTSGNSGTGNGSLGYGVAANSATSTRTGTLSVSGQTFTVTQAAASASCSYSISPTSASPAAAPTTGTVNVTAGSGCAWTASSTAVWLTVTSGASGTGNGTVGYSVAANSATSSRTGTLTIGGQTFTVTQAASSGGGGSCGSTPAKAEMTSPAPSSTLGGTSVTFSWTAGCQATAYWLHVGTSAGATDKFTQNTGTATSVTVNTAPTSGTVYVRLWTQLPSGWQSTDYTYTGGGSGGGGGSCTYTVTPTSANAPATGSSGTVSVTSGSGCAWTASSTAGWLSITAGSSGTGNGSVGYSVAANSASSSRSGALTIGGQTVTVTQAAASGGGGGGSCTTPAKAEMTSPTPGSTLGGSSVTFSWTAGCQAIAYWLHVGTTAGGADKFTQNIGTATTVIVNTVPTGGTVYVRLWTQLSSGWTYNDYTYTTQ